jgi:hypothetical protein
MQPYIKIYLDYFNYTEGDFLPCECCGAALQDFHHISCRGMGGSKTKDFIENIMGLCRFCHIEYGDKKQYMEYLAEIHKKFMEK